MDAGETTFSCNGSEPLVEEYACRAWAESLDYVESGCGIVENGVDKDFEVRETERSGFRFIEVIESSCDDGLQTLKYIILVLSARGIVSGQQTSSI